MTPSGFVAIASLLFVLAITLFGFGYGIYSLVCLAIIGIMVIVCFVG